MNHQSEDAWYLSRRALLAAAGRVAALASSAIAVGNACAVATEATSTPDIDLADIRYIVTDQRLPHSLTFARTLSMQGGQLLQVTEGLTRLWQESLVPLWRTPEGAVAGLTTIAVWHCLAEQARSQSRQTRVLEHYAANAAQPLVAWIIA